MPRRVLPVSSLKEQGHQLGAYSFGYDLDVHDPVRRLEQVCAYG